MSEKQKNHKIKETIEFIHNEISIFVKIDYLNNRVDIVEPIDHFQTKFKKKEFIFIGRGVEYMQGWRNILEAVSEATKYAQKLYESNLAMESSFKAEKMLDIINLEKKNETKK